MSDIEAGFEDLFNSSRQDRNNLIEAENQAIVERQRTLHLAQNASRLLLGASVIEDGIINGSRCWVFFNNYRYSDDTIESPSSSEGPSGLFLTETGQLGGYTTPSRTRVLKIDTNFMPDHAAKKWLYNATPQTNESAFSRHSSHWGDLHFLVNPNPSAAIWIEHEKLVQSLIVEFLIDKKLV